MQFTLIAPAVQPRQRNREPGPPHLPTVRQLDALRAIGDLSALRGFPPTVRDIAACLGVGVFSAKRHLEQLLADGLLVHVPRLSRSMRLTVAGKLYADGWQHGPPSHVSEECIGIDRRCIRAMRCGSCHRRGLVFVVMHKPVAGGDSLYGGYCACRRCGYVEEA